MKQLDLLIQLAHGIASHFGNNCEIVIHDIKRNDINSSIVYIENGHISNRSIGDAPSAVVIKTMQKHPKDIKDDLAYLTKTGDGRILKSSTIFIRDDEDNIVYILSLNYDITSLISLDSSIRSLIETSNGNDTQAPLITHNVNDLLDTLIEQSVAIVGKPVSVMTKNDKIRAIKHLNDAGAFLITRSGDKVSNYFNISKFTLYSYIEAAKQLDSNGK